MNTAAKTGFKKRAAMTERRMAETANRKKSAASGSLRIRLYVARCLRRGKGMARYELVISEGRLISPSHVGRRRFHKRSTRPPKQRYHRNMVMARLRAIKKYSTNGSMVLGWFPSGPRHRIRVKRWRLGNRSPCKLVTYSVCIQSVFAGIP